MADTLENIRIPSKIHVDLYAASGIAVGTQIIVTNVGSNEAVLYTAAAAHEGAFPPGYIPIRPYEEKTNDTGDAGEFAYSTLGTTFNVRRA